MLALIEENRSQIAVLCKRYGVERLELFGSAARGTFDASSSDLDFFVNFIDQNWEGSFKRYMGLKLELEDLFSLPVDLVEPHAIRNPHFTQVASQHREVVYAAA